MFQDDLEGHDKWLSEKMLSNKNILKGVGVVLEAYDKLEPGHQKLVEMEGKSIDEAIAGILMNSEIQKHILPNEDIFQRYEEALITSGRSAKSIILKRHPKDRYMNNYNPEWIFAWNGNMDLQVCLDFFQVISYITDYYSKDDSGTIEYLKKAKKEMVDKNMSQQLRQMANTFLSHRRMGEAEAVYRVTPDMHLSESNIKCVYVQTGWPETRYIHAEKVTNDVNDPRFVDDTSVFEIDNRWGLYKESTTLLSKYERTKGKMTPLIRTMMMKLLRNQTSSLTQTIFHFMIKYTRGMTTKIIVYPN